MVTLPLIRKYQNVMICIDVSVMRNISMTVKSAVVSTTEAVIRVREPDSTSREEADEREPRKKRKEEDDIRRQKREPTSTRKCHCRKKGRNLTSNDSDESSELMEGLSKFLESLDLDSSEEKSEQPASSENEIPNTKENEIPTHVLQI
ncbi:hypothetical protein C0J52_19158 [Blattella germanica]|nr:hypothetical protein C0J52_19158 [Blattella germanica]